MEPDFYSPQEELPLLTQLDGLEASVEGGACSDHNEWCTCTPDLLQPDEFPPEGMQPTSDAENELSTIFLHSGWLDVRRRVHSALKASHATAAACSAFATCGWNSWCLASDTEPVQYRVVASWCNSKWCRVCQRRRAMRLAGRLAQLVSPKRTRFITLTLRANEEPLRCQVQRIYQAFRRLRQRVLWKNTQSGGVAFLEVTRGANDTGWHVHLHILATGGFIDKTELSAAWKQITGDSFIVDIRWVRSVRNAIQYVCKYVGKGYSDKLARDERTMITLINHLHNVRTYCVFGDWRAVLAEEPDDTITWKPISPLGSLLRRAYDGDTEAERIVRAIDPWLQIPESQKPPPSKTGSGADDPVDRFHV